MSARTSSGLCREGKICLMCLGLDDDHLLWSRSLLLDNERWKQAEVPAEFQDLVNSIADGRITLPERKIPGNTHLCSDVSASSLLSVCASLRQEHIFSERFSLFLQIWRRGSLQSSCWLMVRSTPLLGMCPTERTALPWGIKRLHAFCFSSGRFCC